MVNKRSLKNSFLLFLAAFIWGVAFVSQSKGMEYVGPFTFNGIRSLIGAAVLVPVIAFRAKRKNPEQGQISLKRNILGGICCGLALTAASMFQQYGILYTTVGKAGFITALYIIFVPIMGIFIRKKVPGTVWISALMAAAGMYLLCIEGSFRVGRGDALVFICALLFSVHILVIDYFSPKADGVLLSCIQFLVCGLVCTSLAFLLEEVRISDLLSGAVPILYAGIMSCGVAYTLQVVGQKDMNPTVAALILSLESVISVLAGWLAYKVGFLKEDQTLTGRQIFGCVIVFAAVILAQLPLGELLKKTKNSVKST